MDRWLGAALAYIPDWLAFQMRAFDRPGCVVAVARRGRLVFERAFGSADLRRSTLLTPRHRFRVASHSKSFTAAGIMKLRERRKLRLDDAAGQYVKALHPTIAHVTIQQLLSHSAGIVRDGNEGGQWFDREPFPDADRLRADLQVPLIIDPGVRFKYSNHGYGLLGLIIEAVTGEPYIDWIRREIIDAAGLTETAPDIAAMPRSSMTLLASGHSGKVLPGGRVIIPGRNPTRAFAPAAGFVSTAADLVRFFGQLSPDSKDSILSIASRREMIRRQWSEQSSADTWYGLGIRSGTLRGWEWFGHGGAFQGFMTRTVTIPKHGLSVSVLTNSIDGLPVPWVDGVLHILQAYFDNGAPSRRTAAWTGRWWSQWSTLDLVPAGDKVFVANPGFFNPFLDAEELEISGRDRAKIIQAPGTAKYGEPVRLVRDRRGRAVEFWHGGGKFLPEVQMAAEMRRRYRAADRR